jgi:hypothetical protein
MGEVYTNVPFRREVICEALFKSLAVWDEQSNLEVCLEILFFQGMDSRGEIKFMIIRHWLCQS